MSGIATAVVAGSVVSGYMSSQSAKKAANRAASAEERAAQLQVDESSRQFDEIQKLLSPYTQAGESAIGQQKTLLGLNGPEAQQAAINQLQSSPQFTSLVQQGENALLQNASATGGLRGGNTQNALATLRPQMLSALIESQYSKLGGLTSIGQNAAAGVGNAGMATTSAINQSLGNIGSAQAGAALAAGKAQSGFYNSIGSAVGMLGGAFGGGGGGGGVSQSALQSYQDIGNVQFGAPSGGGGLYTSGTF